LDINYYKENDERNFSPKKSPLNTLITDRRKDIFRNILYFIIKDYHDKFLRKKRIGIRFDPMKQKTWHHEFDPDKECKDIPLFEIPPPPEYISSFESVIAKNDLKQTYFDYSLIGLNILESNNEKSYKQKRNECPNVVKRIMYHGTQIDAIADILTNEFKYSRRPFFGMGIYFSDMIDYITFYCGGNNFNERRDNFGKILPVGKSFSFIASEIFYDSTKKNHIKDLSLAEKDLDYFPTYETLKRNFQNKMVQPNGIHFIQVKEDGYPIGEKTIIESDRGFVGHEYVITELYQILPIYSLTLKRNEYFVLWYDQNFSKKNDFSKDLYERKLFCDTQANMNIYCESNLFEALKFLWKRRYNKIILISSVNKDGKIFIKIARLILEFKALVLFYGDKNSSNNNIFKWIKDFENCLYTDDKAIYEYYISKFKVCITSISIFNNS